MIGICHPRTWSATGRLCRLSLAMACASGYVPNSDLTNVQFPMLNSEMSRLHRLFSLPALARLLVATLLLATASLALFPAPTHFLWMVAIGATELGHVLALICI